jgi:hypothetical protein
MCKGPSTRRGLEFPGNIKVREGRAEYSEEKNSCARGDWEE